MKHADMSFADRVREVVRRIPAGSTMTYAQVAAAVGNPKAARAVGAVMRTNYLPDVPCHRVVRSDGTVGEYNRGGVAVKASMLAKEACAAART